MEMEESKKKIKKNSGKNKSRILIWKDIDMVVDGKDKIKENNNKHDRWRKITKNKTNEDRAWK